MIQFVALNFRVCYFCKLTLAKKGFKVNGERASVVNGFYIQLAIHFYVGHKRIPGQNFTTIILV